MEKQVADPELRAKLTPSYVMGCKRILPSNDWYPALQQPNVELITDGIREIRPEGIVTADGRRARGRHDRAGNRLQGDRHLARPPDPRCERRVDGRHLEGQPPGLSRHVGGRVPEPVLRHRPQHRPGPQLAALHDRGAAELRARCAAPDAPARRDPDRGPARRGRGLQRIHPAPPGPLGVEHRRLLELVPRRDGPEHHDLALLHVALLAEDTALRPRAVRADERRLARRGPRRPQRRPPRSRP